MYGTSSMGMMMKTYTLATVEELNTLSPYHYPSFVLGYNSALIEVHYEHDKTLICPNLRTGPQES